MDTYEVLVVEDGIYYIEFYVDGMEFKPTPIRLSREEYERWKIGKVEV